VPCLINPVLLPGRLLRKEEKPEDSLYRKQISTMIETLLKKFSKDYGSKIIENPLIEDTIQKLLLKQSFLHFVMKSTN